MGGSCETRLRLGARRDRSSLESEEELPLCTLERGSETSLAGAITVKSMGARLAH
jgi:hypothetical protein